MEEQMSNHTHEEIIETPDTHQETEQIETQPEVETPQPEGDFIPVKYNKEERRISRDEAPDLIQKGLYYDEKVKGQYESQAQYLDRLAKMSGYQTTEELFNAIEEAEKEQQIQQNASKLGIDEEAYRQHYQPINDELSQVKSQLESMQQIEKQREAEAELNEVRNKFSDFDTYQDKVFELAIDKGYSLEDAYKLSTYEDKMHNIARQKEQEVLAKVTGRDEKQVLASNDKPSSTKFDPVNMSLDQIQELSRRVRSGERITF
ncbi:hypothetical protein [Bacillus sp. J37]|uniref:hypothetical protein n=1 Tax=Bacillus sp. J37 TaxID=935837 RepID=UPI00047B8B87|nr:hypothetical protein [Bacillus sp. J37]